MRLLPFIPALRSPLFLSQGERTLCKAATALSLQWEGSSTFEQPRCSVCECAYNFYIEQQIWNQEVSLDESISEDKDAPQEAMWRLRILGKPRGDHSSDLLHWRLPSIASPLLCFVVSWKLRRKWQCCREGENTNVTGKGNRNTAVSWRS